MKKHNSTRLSAVVLALSVVSATAFANECTIEAGITQIEQDDNGNIILAFDQPTGCGCVHNNKLSFHKDSSKFFISAALTALTIGKPVNATGSDRTCSSAGAAVLTKMSLKSGN